MMAERKLTDLQLERTIAEDRELDTRATEADRVRLAELRAANDKFLASVDIDMEVRRIEQRVARQPRRAWFRWAAPLGALAAAAAVALVLIRRPAVNDQGDDIQTKGGIALVIHTAGGSTLATGDSVAAGERIRFEVAGTQAGFVAVIGTDSAGTRTVYYPYGGSQAVAIGDRDRVLPGAIQLDATPGDERFVAVFSTRPFALDPLPSGLVSSEVVLHKK